MVIHNVEIEHLAKLELRKAYKYISKSSYQNAEKVKAKIIESFKSLPKHPDIHPPDKYCLNRITYYIDENRIIVLRIRHTKMNPVHY